MTAFVLDASVTAAWLLPDEASEHTRRLYALIRRDEVEPQAPNLWQWECVNIIANGVDAAAFRRLPSKASGRCWNRFGTGSNCTSWRRAAQGVARHRAGQRLVGP